MSLRPKDGEHLIALHPGPHFNFADVRQILFELFQNADDFLAIDDRMAADGRGQPGTQFAGVHAKPEVTTNPGSRQIWVQSSSSPSSQKNGTFHARRSGFGSSGR